VSIRELILALSPQYPGLEPLPPEAYDWKPVTEPSGDLGQMLGRPEMYPETQALEPVARRGQPTLDTVYDSARLPQQGDKESWPSLTRNERASGKALVFGDSFSKAWHPFLGQHFQEVIYLRQTAWNLPLIEREKPDVVIDEMLERVLNLADPLELAPKETPAT
jgi:hypothetical protein